MTNKLEKTETMVCPECGKERPEKQFVWDYDVLVCGECDA